MKTETFKEYLNKFSKIGYEMDYSIFVRAFSGRMTKKRREIIQKYCDKYSYNISDCGCVHDCCGCLLGESFSFTYSQNQVVITRSLFYNY